MLPPSFPFWAWPLAGLLLGAIVGSYLATLALRWPRGESASRGRSRCERCGRVLGPGALVPLLSFLWLRGRCGACGGAIDPHHPAMEAAAALIGGIAFFLFPGPQGLAAALLGWLLLLLAVLDVEHLWLPDRLTRLLALTGLAGGLLGMAPPLADRLIGGIAGFGVLAAIRWAYRRLRGREGLGGGDAKLLGAIGLWTGWQALPLILLGASGAGLLGAAALALAGRRIGARTRVPLGALLALAAWPVWLWAAMR